MNSVLIRVVESLKGANKGPLHELLSFLAPEVQELLLREGKDGTVIRQVDVDEALRELPRRARAVAELSGMVR